MLSKFSQAFSAGALLLAMRLSTSAQEAVRFSLAGDEAAAARQLAASDLAHSDLRLGPTAWNFHADLSLEVNDNILLSPAPTESDVIFRPQLATRMLWPLTDQNTLNLAFSAGYSAYVQHSSLDRFFIAPDSELSFDAYAGDFWFNFHDRLSITENEYQDPTAVGVGNYSQLQNDAGLTTTCDLNKLVLRLSYDHVNYALVSGSPGLPDGTSEVFYFSAGYTLQPGLVAGPELGGSLLHYSGATTPVPDAAEANAGAFLEAQLSEHIHLRANGGYSIYAPADSATQPPPTKFTGAYGQLTFSHKINQFLDYSLSGGRTVNFAFFGGTVDLATALLQLNWNLVHNVSLGTFFQYDHGVQLFSGNETFNRYGPGLGLGTRLTSKLSGNVRYQFYRRDSNLAGGDYSLNLLTLAVEYKLSK